MEQNDELTAPNLQKKIYEEFGVNFSESKVKWLQKKTWLGADWYEICLEFCLQCQEDSETFDNIIISDECSVHMEKHAKLSFRHKWEQPKFKGHAKHPYKVHVWAGISKRGATRVLVFTGNVDAKFNVEEILGRTLLPFIRATFLDGHRFQQDNDSKHTSRLAKEFMESSGIHWWKTPSESPDLNPIEMLWHLLKHFL